MDQLLRALALSDSSCIGYIHLVGPWGGRVTPTSCTHPHNTTKERVYNTDMHSLITAHTVTHCVEDVISHGHAGADTGFSEGVGGDGHKGGGGVIGG